MNWMNQMLAAAVHQHFMRVNPQLVDQIEQLLAAGAPQADVEAEIARTAAAWPLVANSLGLLVEYLAAGQQENRHDHD